MKDIHKDVVTLETEGDRPSIVAEMGEIQLQRFKDIQNQFERAKKEYEQREREKNERLIYEIEEQRKKKPSA